MTGTRSPLFRRNFVLGVVNGALINAGMAFLDPFTILPLFITRLGGSSALVGLVSALHGVGWFLPQVAASRLAETRRRVMPMYRVVSVWRVAALAATVWCASALDPSGGRLLAVFVILLLVTHLAGGVAAIPFLEVTSKTIPVERRGRFFALRRIFGGLLGIGAGMVAGLVLDRHAERAWMGGAAFDYLARVTARLGLLGHEFPADFVILFAIGSACMTLGMGVLAFAGETEARRVQPSAPFLDHVRSGLRLLRSDATYRRFYWLRICWQLTAMTFPFYATYAFKELGLSDSTVGLFLSVSVGAGLFSNFLWGRLLDRRGNRIVLLLTALISALPPAAVLGIDLLRGAGGGTGLSIALLLTGAFALNGLIRSGRIISNITYLLELAPPDRRPLYVGFMNSFTFPLMLSPLLGGLVLAAFGVRVLFTISLLFAVWNVVLTVGLPEPRTSGPRT